MLTNSTTTECLVKSIGPNMKYCKIKQNINMTFQMVSSKFMNKISDFI